jgi:3-oxoacyl-[acyl-carrier protein] reductase
MDTGIVGRKAIVCASTQGLGFACAQALLAEGCEVIINGRDSTRLEAAVSALRAGSQAIDGKVSGIVADISTEIGRSAMLGACQSADILINNNAGPAPGVLADWDHSAWIKALEANLLAAALLMRDTIPGMRARGFGRIVNITSAMVKSPHPLMGLSTAARAGLTALSKSLARDVVQDNVTINNLLPERFDTPRQEFMAQKMMREQGITRDQARAQIVATIPAGRFGRPEEFGAACVFLCSAHAGFISGQNLQLDGGAYHGLV